jgi:NADH-quinone oxidoreductase subunit H
MTTCLKYLIPISCLLFAGTVVYPLVLVQMSGQTSIIGQPAGERLVKPKRTAAASVPQDSAVAVTGREGSGR